jgi:hypothetical protein
MFFYGFLPSLSKKWFVSLQCMYFFDFRISLSRNLKWQIGDFIAFFKSCFCIQYSGIYFSGFLSHFPACIIFGFLTSLSENLNCAYSSKSFLWFPHLTLRNNCLWFPHLTLRNNCLRFPHLTLQKLGDVEEKRDESHRN